MNEKPKTKPQLWTLSDTAISTRMGSYNYSIGLKQFTKMLLEITPHSWRDIDDCEVQPNAPHDKTR